MKTGRWRGGPVARGIVDVEDGNAALPLGRTELDLRDARGPFDPEPKEGRSVA